ncbi:redoxin family protein [Pedobacter duraquae]|uniref:Uncharacterized protein (TIGR03435 family) n=1 Tax=Pedobacter duraquae TaxID=425511 RepID=A0A4R6IRW7_9SPHI|nr:redoxin family protein [Pedobacter duraquae]TDO24941.1 uncharacterized protein (TIGR03435 family) [Pedobacter duraquae]
MKRIFLLTLLGCLTLTATAQIKIGESIGNVPIVSLLNAPIKKTDLSSQRGKVVLLEFWATWCGPCVDAMPHLQALQKQFGNKLQIITVSTEKEKRIKQFLQNRPSNLWFAIDSADAFRKDFPYHTIPHSILIDQQGVIAAITEPVNITESVIADVVAGKKINLPFKEDNMNMDPWNTYFKADPSVESRFLIQPKIQGASTGVKHYTKATDFNGRRISFLNMTVEGMYRIAYGDLPYGRTIDLIPREDKKDNEKMYCVDFIVPKGREAELLATLRAELKSRFDLNASVEKRLKVAYILKVADPKLVAKIELSKLKEQQLNASGAAFNGEGVTFATIANYLEDFGVTNIPVIDETKDSKRYDISFNFMPEKKGDYLEELHKLGLDLVKSEREIDVLIFR